MAEGEQLLEVAIEDVEEAVGEAPEEEEDCYWRGEGQLRLVEGRDIELWLIVCEVCMERSLGMSACL